MKILAFTLAVATTTVTGTVGQATTPPTGATPTMAATPTGKQRCVSVIPTGRRIPTKVCRTVKEWDAESEANRRVALELLNGPVVSEARGN